MSDAFIPLVEARAEDVLSALPPCTICVNDPPWSGFAASLAAASAEADLRFRPAQVLVAGSMERADLEQRLHGLIASDVVVGFGGGSALDTAKFIAWRTGRRLVQIPTITSVDAAFTDAVGVREAGRVRYVGPVLAERVVLDVDLVSGAPAALNRAGIGDVLSCHTGLRDWMLATRRSEGPPWDTEAAALGQRLLQELPGLAGDLRAVTPAAVRWLARAYQAIGSACHRLGHSRFEEGAEHHFAYAYEHLTGAHPLHGEIIALGTAVVSDLQNNAPDWVRAVLADSGVRCHPEDLGISEADFRRTLAALPAYCASENLPWTIVNECALDADRIDGLWRMACGLPRAPGQAAGEAQHNSSR